MGINMLKHYLIAAVRSATRQKLHTLINLFGLIIGITASTLIYLWIMDELSTDGFHVNGNSIYRIEQDQYGYGQVFHVNITSYPMGEAIKEELPEVIDMTRIGWTGELLLRQGDIALYENRARIVDPSFLSMFSFPLYEGNAAMALNDPSSVVITRQLANKLFGTDTGLIGKAITVNNENQMLIGGVLENIPANSSLKFNMLVPYEYARAAGMVNDSWRSNEIPTYIQLAPTADIAEVSEKISALHYTRTAQNPDISSLLKTERGTPVWEAVFSLRAVPDIYLTGHFGYGESAGRIKYVYILSIIGFVVIMLACVNFMNLTISRANRRAYEVGLRKTVGATRSQLVVQYFGESLMFALVAAVGALILVEFLLPSFNAWSGKDISLEMFGDSYLPAGVIGLVLLTAIAAGTYPALILSSFRPGAFMGNQLTTSPAGQLLRRVTVTAQFIISLVLLVGTGVVFHQTEYMNTKDVGYDTKNLISIPLRGDMNSGYEEFRQELSLDPHIISVTGSMQHPSYNSANTGGVGWTGKNEENKTLIGVNIVDYDFVETMGIEMLEGRSFDRNRAGDSSGTFVINKEFADIITGGDGSALGATLTYGNIKGEVIGVTKSFNRTSLLRATEPTVLIASASGLNYAFVRLTDDSRESLAALESGFSTVYSDYPFNYSFYDEDLADQYRFQEQLASILRTSGGIAILIACLGMFGLASLSAERRLKELAIRKVLGATTRRLFGSLAREYIYVIILANAIGIPLAYYLSNSWLEEFAYRIDIEPILFIKTGLVILIMAFIAVSHHFIRAASTSPARVLQLDR